MDAACNNMVENTLKHCEILDENVDQVDTQQMLTVTAIRDATYSLTIEKRERSRHECCWILDSPHSCVTDRQSLPKLVSITEETMMPTHVAPIPPDPTHVALYLLF